MAFIKLYRASLLSGSGDSQPSWNEVFGGSLANDQVLVHKCYIPKSKSWKTMTRHFLVHPGMERLHRQEYYLLGAV